LIILSSSPNKLPRQLTHGFTRRALNLETFQVSRMKTMLFAVGCTAMFARDVKDALFP
jgi:hypothetical protein